MYNNKLHTYLYIKYYDDIVCIQNNNDGSMDVNINNSTPTNAETMKIVAEAKKIEQQTIQVIHIWHNTNTYIYCLQ